MNMGMGQVFSQAMSHRQRLEEQLSQDLSVQQRQALEIKLYLKREGELTRLYSKALERDKVKLYDKHGMKFEYALIPKREVPKGLEEYGMAFSHCLFNSFEALFFGTRHAMAKGSWLLFVIEDMYPGMPSEYLEYAAVHERGEQVTLGDHNLASKLEFAIALSEKKLTEYIKWLEQNSPLKFVDIFSYQVKLDLPDSDEFQQVLDLMSSSEEATTVRGLIERFEWPMMILRKLNFYQNQHDKALGIVVDTLRDAELLIQKGGWPIKELVDRIRETTTVGLRQIKGLKLERYVNFQKMDPVWQELRKHVEMEFLEHLQSKQRVMAPLDYIKEAAEVGITGGLPQDGVLSPIFLEALRAL